jgi:hypothetical protein
MVAFCPTCAEAGKRVPLLYNIQTDQYVCPKCRTEYARDSVWSGKVQPVTQPHAR